MHFLLIILLAATHSQIITAYTIIRYSRLDGYNNCANSHVSREHSATGGFRRSTTAFESQYAEPKGACMGYKKRVIHVTCEGPEVDFDTPVDQSFWVVLNCEGGEFDVFYLFVFSLFMKYRRSIRSGYLVIAEYCCELFTPFVSQSHRLWPSMRES